jgi:transposase
MSEDRLCCKRCGGEDYVKSGLARGHQRYRCQGCGCHFTNTPRRGKPAAMKALAMLLYGMGNMSFSMIGRLLGVSDVAVLKWVRAEASALPEPEVSTQVVTVEVDEMWHFIKKSLPSYGSGAPMTLIHGALWPGFWVGVMMQPVVACSTKSA